MSAVFRFSIIITFLLLGLAGAWGWHRGGMAGALDALWIAAVLGVLEVSLSFDNAIVNASVLKRWDAAWRRLFLTVGILVAVFGMRLLFPLLIVAVATGLPLPAIWDLASHQPAAYAAALAACHDQVAAFGGAFLLLVFLNFLFDGEREQHWLGAVEAHLGQRGDKMAAVALALLASVAGMAMADPGDGRSVLLAGVGGVLTYVAVDGLTGLLAGHGPSAGGLGGFLYLEVLDASFSFDGVVGAFALSQDVVLIMLGLAIGALFVRTLTVTLVERGTLDAYIYLEHGAHYAIGLLAAILFASIRHPVPDWVTGLGGVAIIGVSFWSSLRARA